MLNHNDMIKWPLYVLQDNKLNNACSSTNSGKVRSRKHGIGLNMKWAQNFGMNFFGKQPLVRPQRYKIT
jgi:hypothetical protein